MNREALIKFVRQLQRYATHKCKKRKPGGFFAKQMLFPRVTNAENRYADTVISTAKDNGYSYERKIWVQPDKLKSTQGCLSIPRLVYQLRRYPFKDGPTVVKLPGAGGFYVIWDGNHRSAAGVLLGRKRIRCTEIKNRR